MRLTAGWAAMSTTRTGGTTADLAPGICLARSVLTGLLAGRPALGPRQPLMHGPAGVGHGGLDAQLSDHVRGRLHFRAPARRMPCRAVDDPLHAARVRRGQFGGDVLAQPL